MRTRHRIGCCLGAGFALVVVTALPAQAATTATVDPVSLVAVLGPPLHGVPGASAEFVALPPSGVPAGVSDTVRPGFPTTGPYVVLSTGEAASADLPNDSPKTTGDNGGGPLRDGAERDVVVLRVDFETPVSGCVLTFDYQFLTEEFPEFGGPAFGDAFVAELDLSTWSVTSGTVTAPNAFVLETAGSTTLIAAAATGSTYDAAKPAPGIGRVVVPTSGAHRLYLSLFDVGDTRYDTAVFVDNLLIC
jgi:hypothetical protein